MAALLTFVLMHLTSMIPHFPLARTGATEHEENFEPESQSPGTQSLSCKVVTEPKAKRASFLLCGGSLNAAIVHKVPGFFSNCFQ